MKTFKVSLSFLVFVLCLGGMYYVAAGTKWQVSIVIQLLSFSLAYMLLKMILSFVYTSSTKPVPENAKVSVIIPSFNEDADTVLESIIALTKQTVPPHEIIFVDDGSSDQRAYEQVLRFSEIHNLSHETPKIVAHAFEKNQGKRHAQLYGFKRATGNFFMLYDSDGTIGLNAIEELLRPMSDPKVYAVCGHINARNRKDNLWTTLQDVMYESAFRVGRAAQSVTGDVVVCSGANSMFRSEHVVNDLDDFMDTTFFGIDVFVGDDRKLTEMMLKKGGKVKYQSTAVCLTDVPTTLRQFFTQQVRWSKSFIVGTLTSMTFAWKRPMLLLWILGESFLWLFFSLSAFSTAIMHIQAFTSILIAYTAAFFVISALTNNVHYMTKHPFLFLCSPFFAMVRMVLIFPIRFWALATLRKTKWGTR